MKSFVFAAALAFPSVALAQTPAVYQDLYAQLTADVSDFRAAVDAAWDGSKAPVVFAGQLTYANSNNGPGLLQPASMDLIQTEILLLKAVGAKAVSVEVSYPMLDASFFSAIGHPDYQSQFTTFYASVAAAIRAQGLQVIVESQSLIPTGLQSVWGAPLQSYYASLTSFSAYQSARERTAALVAQTMRPDWFVLQEEPDTESAQSGQASAGSVNGSVSMLSGTLAAVRQTNVSGMKVGAGFGSWLQAYKLFANGFTRQKCGQTVDGQTQPCITQPLDFLDLHLFPINERTVDCSPPPGPRPCTAPNFWQNALDILATARSAGLPVTISQTWLRKVRDGEWMQISGDIQEAREAYDFWGPLDLAFLHAVADFAHFGRMGFVVPFNTQSFSAYLAWSGGGSTCTVSTSPSCTALSGEGGGNTPVQLFAAVQGVGKTNVATATYSSVGTGWHALIVTDTTPPSDPTNVTAQRTFSTTATLSWTPSTDDVGVAGYHVWRNGVKLPDVFQPPFLDTGLTPSVTYGYQVQAFDLSGNASAVVGTPGSGVTSSLFVPIVLSSAGMNGSFFTSELTLTNKGPSSASITYTYTAAFGGGSGTATDQLGAGKQLVASDAIEYLRGKGIPIPGSGARGGTLRVDFGGLSSATDAAALVRTATPVPPAAPIGRAGLAYAGLRAGSLLTGTAYLCGLRQTAADRTNVALQNAGSSSDGDVTLNLTLFGGDTGTAAGSLTTTLLPGGFQQVTLPQIAASATSGWVKVERTAGTAPYSAYAVINDNANSDGSFVPPVASGTLLAAGTGITLPVVVEASVFTTEVVLTNVSAVRKSIQTTYVADPIASGSAAASFDLAPGQQLILPAFVQALRDKGVVGAAGPSFVGPLFVTVPGGDTGGLFVGGQTSNPGGGGKYGVFYTGVPYGAAATTSAWLYGLRQDEQNRTNLALVNTGETDASSDTLKIELFDGDTGVKVGETTQVVGARKLVQIGKILSTFTPSPRNAYTHVTRLAGANPFIAYAVINDGANPGERSGDGAFVASDQSSTVTLTSGTDIQAAVEANPPGTTFRLAAGIYRLTTGVVPKSGDAFLGEPGAVLTGSIELDPARFVREGDHWTIGGQNQPPGPVPAQDYWCTPQTDACRICQPQHLRCKYPEDLYLDDRPLEHVASLAAIGPGRWFFDYARQKIHLGDDPAGHHVELSFAPFAIASGVSPVDNVLIRGLRIEKFATPIAVDATGLPLGGNCAVNTSGGGESWTVEDNEIRLNHACGVSVGTRGKIINNRLHDNGEIGFMTDGAGAEILISGNEIYANNFAGFHCGWECGGCKLWETTNAKVVGNYSHHNLGPGLWTDGYNRGTLYENNRVENNSEFGILHEISYAAVIRGNVVRNNGTAPPDWELAGAQMAVSNSRDVEIYDNTIEVDARSGNGIILHDDNRRIPRTEGNRVHDNRITVTSFQRDGFGGRTGGVSDSRVGGEPPFVGGNLFDANRYNVEDPRGAYWVWKDGPVDFVTFQSYGFERTGSVGAHNSSTTGGAQPSNRQVEDLAK